MPSPVGHVIAGVAAGWLVAGAPRSGAARQQRVREAVLFGALGALPDIDLLFGLHSGPTHSLGAATIVAVIACLVRAPSGVSRAMRAAACFAAYGSHVLLDWLATDSTAPIGIMALWPFTYQHYESDVHVFMAISRRYHQGWVFVRQNALALMRELAILIPVLWVVGRGRAQGSGLRQEHPDPKRTAMN